MAGTPAAGRRRPVNITSVLTDSIKQTPENWDIYRWDACDDPAFLDLIESVRAEGVLEPLVISVDRYVLSGHRRLRAAQAAGVEDVPVIIEPIEIEPMESEERVRLLIKHNRGSRRKTQEEILRENMAEIDPSAAIAEAENRRVRHLEKSEGIFEHVKAVGVIKRHDPRGKRREIFEAVVTILGDFNQRRLLPVSVRGIHYKLLAMKVETSSQKRGHLYGTGGNDSKTLSRLITDARSWGLIEDSWISDETRPTYEPALFASPADYVEEEMANILGGYWVDPHVDQESHVEIVVEKNTVFPLIRSKAGSVMRMPVSSGRGYSSYSQRARLHERFKRSGKENLVLIYVGDHDPEGIDMPKALVRAFVGDFGTTPKVVRAAVTIEQIERLKLPPDIEAKESSSRFKTYVEQTGFTDAWEVDSMDPEVLVEEVLAACRSVIDVDLFNKALVQEKEDDVRIARLKAAVQTCIKSNAHLINREGQQ
jgi:hypothetical protein